MATFNAIAIAIAIATVTVTVTADPMRFQRPLIEDTPA